MEICLSPFISRIPLTQPNTPRKNSFQSFAATASTLQHNYQSLIFRDTFTRQKYRLGTIKPDCWVMQSPRQLLNNILNNRNRQIMKASIAKKEQREAKFAKQAQARQSSKSKASTIKKLPVKKRRCQSSHINDQENLRLHLYQKKPLSALIPKKVDGFIGQVKRRGRQRVRQHRESENVETKCDKLCRQIEYEVRNKLSQECRYLIEPDNAGHKILAEHYIGREPIKERKSIMNYSENVESFSNIKENISEMEKHLAELGKLRDRQLKALRGPAVTDKAQKFIDAIVNSDILQVQFTLKDCPQLVNAQDSKGNTGLHLAARKGDILIIQFLLKKGANPGIRNKFGKLSMDIARHFDQKEAQGILRNSLNFMDAKQTLLCTLLSNS